MVLSDQFKKLRAKRLLLQPEFLTPDVARKQGWNVPLDFDPNDLVKVYGDPASKSGMAASVVRKDKTSPDNWWEIMPTGIKQLGKGYKETGIVHTWADLEKQRADVATQQAQITGLQKTDAFDPTSGMYDVVKAVADKRITPEDATKLFGQGWSGAKPLAKPMTVMQAEQAADLEQGQQMADMLPQLQPPQPGAYGTPFADDDMALAYRMATNNPQQFAKDLMQVGLNDKTRGLLKGLGAQDADIDAFFSRPPEPRPPEPVRKQPGFVGTGEGYVPPVKPPPPREDVTIGAPKEAKLWFMGKETNIPDYIARFLQGRAPEAINRLIPSWQDGIIPKVGLDVPSRSIGMAGGAVTETALQAATGPARPVLNAAKWAKMAIPVRTELLRQAGQSIAHAALEFKDLAPETVNAIGRALPKFGAIEKAAKASVDDLIKQRDEILDAMKGADQGQVAADTAKQAEIAKLNQQIDDAMSATRIERPPELIEWERQYRIANPPPGGGPYAGVTGMTMRGKTPTERYWAKAQPEFEKAKAAFERGEPLPEVKPAPPIPEAKQPWQMTQREAGILVIPDEVIGTPLGTKLAEAGGTLDKQVDITKEWKSLDSPILRQKILSSGWTVTTSRQGAGKDYRVLVSKTQSALADAIRHKVAVKRAISEGKPVAERVLADYPDLAKGLGAQPALRETAPISSRKAVRGGVTGPIPAKPTTPIPEAKPITPPSIVPFQDPISKKFALHDVKKDVLVSRFYETYDEALAEANRRATAPKPTMPAVPSPVKPVTPPQPVKAQVAGVKPPAVEAPLVKEAIVAPTETTPVTVYGVGKTAYEQKATVNMIELKEGEWVTWVTPDGKKVTGEVQGRHVSRPGVYEEGGQQGYTISEKKPPEGTTIRNLGEITDRRLSVSYGNSNKHIVIPTETPTVKPGELPKAEVPPTVPPEKPPKKPPEPPPDIPEPSPSITPGPMAENVIGLRTIEPGLTRGQTIGNIVKRQVNPIITKTGAAPMVEYEPMANAALVERARVHTAIESNANVLGTEAENYINKAFTLDKQGRVASLAGVNPDVPGAPTIADIAARLPTYEAALSAEQKVALSKLKQAVQPYRDLMTEVGIEIPSRQDVMEGGFYLPRGRAALEGVDEPFKVGGGRRGTKKGFEKPALFESQAQGIEAGYEYSTLGESLTSYGFDAGNRATDAHIVNYFKALTDETGKLIGETPKMRMLRQNPELVTKIDEVKKTLNRLKSNLDVVTNKQADIISMWQEDPDFAELDDVLVALSEMKAGKLPPKTRDDIIALIDQSTADLKAMRPEYKKALRRAQATPRDQGVISLPALQGVTFPDEIANAANIILNKQGITKGALAPVVNAINAMNNLYRGVKATGDLSFMGIQGLIGAYGNPKAYAAGVKLGVEAWGIGGDKILGAFMRDFDAKAVKNGLLKMSEWAKGGMHIGGATSEFQFGGPGSKISQLPIVKQANRSFGFMGDALRATWANNELATQLKKRTLAEIKASGDIERIANGANVLTGWTTGKFAGSFGELLQFAPKFFQSRLETVAKGAMGLRPGATLDQQIARNSLLKMIAFGTLLTVAANTAQGEETDFRLIVDGRRNGKFMRIKWGDQYYSLFGTWDSLVGMFTNIAIGKPLTAIRSQLSGSASMAWDIVSGRDYDYNATRDTPAHFAQWAARQVVPFFAGQVPEGIGMVVKGVQESEVGKTVAGVVKVVSLATGIKGFPKEDWETNFRKLGLPIYDDPALLSNENPNYLTSNYYSATLSQLGDTKPDEVIKNKDFPERVKSIVQAQQLGKNIIDILPNKTLHSIEANPLDKNGKPQDTYVEFYNQWNQLEKLIAAGDKAQYIDKRGNKHTGEDAIKAFKGDYKEATKGNFGDNPQTKFALLQRFHMLLPTDKKGREQFIRDNPLIGSNPELDYYKEYPEDNALMALYGQAKIHSVEAYTKAMALAKKLDYPDSSLPAFEVKVGSRSVLIPTDPDTRDALFKYQETIDKFGSDSPEAHLMLAQNNKLHKFLNPGVKPTPGAYNGIPIPALEIDVKNRKLNDQAEGLNEKDLADFKVANPGWAEDQDKIAIYKHQYKYDSTVADDKMVKKVLAFKKLETEDEKDLARLKDVGLNQWLETVGPGGTALKPLTNVNADVLELRIKNAGHLQVAKGLTGDALNRYYLANKEFGQDHFKMEGLKKGLEGKALTNYIAREMKDTEYTLKDKVQKEAMLKADPVYAKERLTDEAISQNVPEIYIPKYIEYKQAPSVDTDAEKRWLKANPNYYKDVYLGILGKEPVDFSKVMSEQFETFKKTTYDIKKTTEERDLVRYLNPWFEQEGLAIGKFTKPVLVKSVTAQRLSIANQAMDDQYSRIVAPADKTAFLKANPRYATSRIQIEGLNKGVPETMINTYVQWKQKPMSKYALERFMSRNLSFYQTVYKRILGEDKLDFRNILSESLEAQLNIYTDLRGAKKTAYLRSHSTLRRWMERRAKLRPSQATDITGSLAVAR